MYKITAAFLLFVLMAVNAESEVEKQEESKEVCPSGWKKYEGRCYKFFKTKKQWIEAEKKCNGSKAHLASVHKPAVNAFLKTFVQKQAHQIRKKHVPRFWIGGYYATKKAAWTWSDGSKFTYTNWKTKPAVKRNKKTKIIKGCVLAATKKGVLHWRDERCTTRLRFVCYKMAGKVKIN